MEVVITLAALITIIILIILATVTINAVFGDNGLIKQAEQAKDYSSNSTESEYEGMNRIYAEYANVMEEDKEIPVAFEPKPTPEPEGGGIEFNMAYGVIEIQWLDEDTNNISNEPNDPKTKSFSNGTMELVKYDESSQSWINGEEYSYEIQNGTTENGGTSKWANARVRINNVDSYFVWIPRYAYRIVYFNNAINKDEYQKGILSEADAIEQGKIVGYSDSRGIVDKNGKK